VSILWQNWLLALSFVPLLCLGFSFFAVYAQAYEGWRWVLAYLAQLGWYVVCAWMIVRSIRLGAYRNSDGRMTIRSLLRTWTIRPDQISAILIFEGVGNWGRTFYFPVLVIDRPGGDKDINLWWLAAVKEPKARAYGARVHALMTATNGEATAAGVDGS